MDLSFKIKNEKEMFSIGQVLVKLRTGSHGIPSDRLENPQVNEIYDQET